MKEEMSDHPEVPDCPSAQGVDLSGQPAELHTERPPRWVSSGKRSPVINSQAKAAPRR
jgi:hypothetical protein